MDTGGSTWDDRRISARTGVKIWNFVSVELRTYLDGAESVQGYSVFPGLTCQEAAGAAQLSCSAVWLAADCISTGGFLFLQVFPDTLSVSARSQCCSLHVCTGIFHS